MTSSALLWKRSNGLGRGRQKLTIEFRVIERRQTEQTDREREERWKHSRTPLLNFSSHEMSTTAVSAPSGVAAPAKAAAPIGPSGMSMADIRALAAADAALGIRCKNENREDRNNLWKGCSRIVRCEFTCLLLFLVCLSSLCTRCPSAAVLRDAKI
jgi:hypothetical protein